MTVEIDPKLCFVLMPRSDDFIELYRDVIEPTVTELELNCLSVGEPFDPRPTMEDVREYCEKARVVIADLTGCDSNVYYGVGYAQAFDRGKVIFIVQNIEEVTFDIEHFRHIVYDPLDRVEEFKRQLTAHIRAVLDQEPQSPRVVTRTVEVPVEVPAPLDEQTQEALELYTTIQAIERGETIVASKQVARLLKLPEQAKIVELEDLPPTPTVGGVELILIPPGEFIMGEGDEADQVSLKAFYIGRYPITNVQYERFMEATGHRAPDHWSGGSVPKEKDNHPVVNMSWHDARAYCQWLAEETGQAVRLPTEAEWERAARGTDGRTYPWGDEFDQGRCNIRGSGIWDTTPVGEYSPQGDSPYGVADMVGNVWEWTSSLFKDYPYDADDGREDPEAEGTRVLRGGSYDLPRPTARVTARSGADPGFFYSDLGFRVAVVRPGSP